MALTYRKDKGSALTQKELDDNFRHFTGSHSITGSLTLSGNLIPSETTSTLGTPDNPWKELYVDDGTVNFISSTNPANSGSLSWSESDSFRFDSNNGGYYDRLNIANQAGPQLVLEDSYNSINIGSGSGGENIGNTSRVGHSVAIGTRALAGLTEANGAVAIGLKAGSEDRTSYSVYIGANAGEGLTTTTGNNVIVGGYAMSQSLATGIGNVAVGGQAGRFNKSNNNTYIGEQAGGVFENGFATSDNNVFIGYQAGWDRISGSNGGNMIVITGKNNSNGRSVGKGANTAVIGNEYITDTYLYGTLNLENVPTTDPFIPGAVWRDGTDLKISI